MRGDMKKKEYKIVEVTWVDAEEKGEAGWNDLKQQLAYAKKPCPVMRSVGYVVYEGEDHIALLSSIGPAECSTIEKIPATFVQKVRELESPVLGSKTGKKKK